MTGAERPGAVLAGRYRVEREIGRGGMAVVFNNDLLTSYLGTPGQDLREEELDNTGPNQPCNTISGQPMHISDTYIWENRWGNGVATTLINTTNNGTVTYPTSDPLGTLRPQDLGPTLPQEDYDHFLQKLADFLFSCLEWMASDLD